MPQITLRSNSQKVYQSLEKVGEGVPRAVKTAMGIEMKRAQKEVAFYPPPPSDRYKRTGRYGRGVKLETTAGVATYTLSTHAVYKGRSYAEFVGGDAKGNGQIERHRLTGWRKLFDAVSDAAKRLLASAPDKIRDAIHAAGMGL